jgi:hypothetical protein
MYERSLWSAVGKLEVERPKCEAWRRERSVKRILVVSFSQSGQLRQIVSALLVPLRKIASVEIVDEILKPVVPFPFPWNILEFLNVFPESFQEAPCQLESLTIGADDHFDLVILAYQVWYLAPSIPINSFLRSDQAKTLLKNKPVLTIVGCRNMWCRAHSRVKDHLHAANARLIGHIALSDRAPNLLSVVTLMHWILSGEKKRVLGVLPLPGVSQADIHHCSDFGLIVADAIMDPAICDLQSRLDSAGACRIIPHLLALENVAARVFRKWSLLIMRSGRRDSLVRSVLVILFACYLACGLAALSPISFLLFYMAFPLRRAAVRRQIEKVRQY